MTLTLRCIRCGDWAEMHPESFNPGVCQRCADFYISLRERGVSKRRAWALSCRYERNIESHPTYKALTGAFETLEAVPPGTLDDNHDVLRAVMLGEPIT